MPGRRCARIISRIMEILQADVTDAKEILELQKLAYQTETELYNDFNIPPLRQTLPEIVEQFKTYIFLKAVSKDKVIGTVRAYEDAGVCHIGKLAVTPEMRNKGIGSALMEKIEKLYTSKRYELFVGSRSSGNISLYQKLGYIIYKKSKYGCGDIEIFYMEKIVK